MPCKTWIYNFFIGTSCKYCHSGKNEDTHYDTAVLIKVSHTKSIMVNVTGFIKALLLFAGYKFNTNCFIHRSVIFLNSDLSAYGIRYLVGIFGDSFQIRVFTILLNFNHRNA
jgi:hypothetical protein